MPNKMMVVVVVVKLEGFFLLFLLSFHYYLVFKGGRWVNRVINTLRWPHEHTGNICTWLAVVDSTTSFTNVQMYNLSQVYWSQRTQMA